MDYPLVSDFNNVLNVDDDGLVYFNDKLLTGKFVDLSKLWGPGFKKVNLDLIRVLFLFRIKIPVSLIREVEWFKIDEQKGIDPSNVWYRFKSGPLDAPGFPGFKIIPYHTGFAINLSSDVVNLKTRVLLQTKDGEMRSQYRQARMVKDVVYRKDRTISFDVTQGCSVHRLKALAFIDYDVDPNNLDVNHIDGDKKNNDIENLEWLTRSGNMNHAYDHGLRSDNISVIVKDWITGEETIHRSITAASKKVTTTSAAISNRINSDDHRVLAGRYSVAKVESFVKWNFDSYEAAARGTRQLLEAKCIFTGRVFHGLSVGALVKEIGDPDLNAGMVSFILLGQKHRKTITRPWNGYFFRYNHDNLEFPELSEIEISYYKKLKEAKSPAKYANPYVVRVDGTEEVYLSVEEAMIASELCHPEIRNKLYRDKLVSIRKPTGEWIEIFSLYENNRNKDLSRFNWRSAT